METSEAVQQSSSAAASKLFDLEGVERLVVPSDPTTKTYIPFGIEGLSVIISPYGEILRMSLYVAEENPRIVCLTSPTMQGYQRDLLYVGEQLHRQAQERETGLGIRLMSASKADVSSFETRLEWLNGRWPCIQYEFDGLAIYVMFIIEKGFLSQQYVIVNPSEKENEIRFDLQIGDCEVNTLRVHGIKWEGLDQNFSAEEPSILPDKRGFLRISERELETPPRDDDHTRSVVRGEAVFAVFHNGSSVTLGDIPISVPRGDGASDDAGEPDRKRPLDSPKSLQIKPKGMERLTVQYRIQSYGSQDSQVLQYLEVEKSLKNDRFGDWSFQQDDNFNPIFRRHLEHILCLCLVSIVPKSGQQRQVAFMNDFTFESGSTIVNDFYIFRYLLFVYQILEIDEHITPNLNSTNQDTTRPDFDKRRLQDRIKEVCEGHLRWCFEKEILLANQSWPLPKFEDGTYSSDNDISRQHFAGSLQMLKLFEFARVFTKETLIVDQCLRSGTQPWLDALIRNRDEKSELWYKNTKKAYVAWEGHRGEGSEWLSLPEYRLTDLVYIWKALKCLEEMVRISDDKFKSETLNSLEESKLRHFYVRKVILQHFLCQEFEAGPSQTADQIALRGLESLSEKAESSNVSFAIAVGRTRERDRLLLYATDTILRDGFEWGFFEDDLEVELLTTKNELTKVNVQLSWKNTIRAQGADREAIWEKPLRYALAIIMADYGSLDSSMSPEQIEKISWERLLVCVAPYGLFADKIDRDTKRLEMEHFPCVQRSSWEIPTLLLRKRVRNLELAFFENPPQFSSLPKENEGVPNEQGVHRISDSVISTDARIAMKKRVILEKKRTRSHKKADMNMVFDPTDRKMKAWLYPFPDFFSPRPPRPPYGSMQEEVETLDDRVNKDLNNNTDDGLREDLKVILKRGVAKWKGFKELRGKEAFSVWNSSAILVDIASHKRNEPYLLWADAEDLDWHLREPRSVEEAKKRFQFVRSVAGQFHKLIWRSYLGPLQVEHALILYLATPTQDRRNMAQFYVRHTSFWSHFHEDVHPLADVWAAELHLGFLQLVDTQERTPNQFNLDNDNVCDGRQRRFPPIVKNSQFDVYKASLGYRFVGDMWDKYWSGWLLAYVPGESRGVGHLDRPNIEENVKGWFDEKLKNDQRKILEPFIVGNMVAEVYQSTDRILRFVDDWLDPDIEFSKDDEGSKESNISKADDRNFGLQYNRSTICLDLDAILSMLRRLSEANVDSLHQWRKREESRHYKPRWSEKDELKYRELVDHQKRRAEQQISLLSRQYRQIETSIDQVRTHRQELMANLDLTQSRTAALNAENVRIFTYATVIFYPLSFVASLFSMQGPPNHSTTSTFIQATAIALVVTLVIVFNAEILAWPIRRLRFGISLTARKKMGETSNMFPVSWKKTLNRIKEAEEQDVLHDIEMPEWPRSKLIYLMFLVIYLMVEFPASRIVLAYESAVKDGARTPESLVLTAIRILIAVIMLPIFVVAWLVLVIWSIMHAVMDKIGTFRKLQEEMNKNLLEEAITGYVEKEERSKEQDGEKGIDRRGTTVITHDEKGGNKKEKELKEQLIERKAKLKEKVEEARRVSRKGKQDRLNGQVKLLINPPKLYEAKTKGFMSGRKKGEDQKGEDQEKTISRTGSAASSSGKGEAARETPDQNLTHKSIWRLARRLKKKAVDDEVAVQGREEREGREGRD